MEIKIKEEYAAALTASALHTGLTEDAYVQAIVDMRMADIASTLRLSKEQSVKDKYNAAIAAKGIEAVEAAIDAVTAEAVDPKPGEEPVDPVEEPK